MKALSLKTSVALVALTIAVPVFAETAASSSSASSKAKMTINTSCMSTAVMKRDTAISTALQTVVTALQTRGSSLSTAWNDSTAAQRKTDVKAANTAFTGTWKTFDKARAAAWKQYATDAKACKVSTTDAGTASTATGGL